MTVPENYIDRNSQNPAAMTMNDAIEEVIADACEEMLANTKYAEMMAKENPTLAESIRQWIRDFTEKIRAAVSPDARRHREAEVMRKYADELQEMWDRALVEATENAEFGMRNETNAEFGIRNAESESGTKASVRETEDGRYAAVVDNDILSGIDTENWNNETKEAAQKAASEALKKFKDGIIVNGITRKVNKISRDEYTRSKDTMDLLRKSKIVFADKMRAADIADDVVAVTTDWNRDGGLKHGRSDSFVDFDHGKTLIQSGENKYEAEIVVGIRNDGEYVFYDVVNMEPAMFTIKEAAPYAAGLTQDVPAAMSEDAADERVPQQSGSVKQKNSDRDGGDLQKKYPQLNLNEDISELDGVPAIELTDGSIIPIDINPSTGRRYLHVEFIERNRIDIDDLKSGGWIGNGVYDPSFQSDTQRYIDREQARKYVARKTGTPYEQFRYSNRDITRDDTAEERAGRSQEASRTIEERASRRSLLKNLMLFSYRQRSAFRRSENCFCTVSN